MLNVKQYKKDAKTPLLPSQKYLTKHLSAFFPFLPGLAIASALIDISQQKPSESKDKTSGVRNRKHHLSTRQGTCV